MEKIFSQDYIYMFFKENAGFFSGLCIFYSYMQTLQLALKLLQVFTHRFLSYNFKIRITIYVMTMQLLSFVTQVEGMGGASSEFYQTFRKQCFTAFLHLRR